MENAEQTRPKQDGEAKGSSDSPRVARTLQFKATVLVVALALGVTVVVSSFFVRSGVRLVRERDSEQLVQLGRMAARAVAPAADSRDRHALANLADSCADGDQLSYIRFMDLEGYELAAAEHGDRGLLVHARRWWANRPPPGVPIAHKVPGERQHVLCVTFPVNVPEAGEPADTKEVRLVGYVHAGLIASEWHEWMSSRLDTAIGAGVLAIGIAIPLGFLLVRRIVSPLDDLAAVMHRFAEGKLDVRSPVRRHDEIGRLVTVFNRMADLHQQTHERIVRLNTTLEKRVSQRTQQLRELAARDPLTGLYNRRHFNEVLRRSMSEALRYDNGLSCLMIDLDDFKAVNDTFGHYVGDEVLVLMASTITSQLRAADVAARYGGDEFVVLLPQTETDQARVLGERIMERFCENIGMCLPKVRASLSVGIASVQLQRAFSADSLLRAADRALYSAKEAGRSCIITAPEAEDQPGACPPAAQFRG